MNYKNTIRAKKVAEKLLRGKGRSKAVKTRQGSALGFSYYVKAEKAGGV